MEGQVSSSSAGRPAAEVRAARGLRVNPTRVSEPHTHAHVGVRTHRPQTVSCGKPSAEGPWGRELRAEGAGDTDRGPGFPGGRACRGSEEVPTKGPNQTGERAGTVGSRRATGR